ncbi:MAG: helix-turn-helix transcriptional regulator [Anaerolineaceae bacterium]|nr:helix-turn-helix transcriptional regulator [Anaerolineaceae bacterium]
MSTQVLATKLYMPTPRPGMVLRPHLIERLNAGLQGKLTLISAPAGFGKTTLTAEWISGGDHPAAWLSLDERDSDPVRFLTYIVTALKTIEPLSGTDILNLLESPQPPPLDALLIPLLNDITTMANDFVLVLDDYHVLESQEIDSGLAFLIDNQPPQMHIVITTREDPRLPVARLRARSQLTELRAADLRFTPEEAAEFLNNAMGLSLSPEDIIALEQRTEGWIAGLQLAAISMQGQKDVGQFIQSFTGSHRFIVDYLVEEVLNHQPDSVRDFLFQTSILDRLSASLCDAVTGRADGHVMIEQLERSNMLIVPLDDQRQWYRYHHLFAEVLQTYARKDQPDQVSYGQRRACEWFEQNGFRSEAIHHALAAKDLARAADLVELSWPVIPQGIQPTVWLGWVKALPDDLVRVRPVLSAGYAWTLLDNGELDAAETRLRDVEWWLDASESASGQSPARPNDMIVANETQFRCLTATTASARAYLALSLGDVPGTVRHAQRALDHLPEDDHYWRGTTALFLGMAHWANGELEPAYKSISLSIASQRKANNHYFQVFGTVILADINIAQGRLRKALSNYERALQLISDPVSVDSEGGGEPNIHATQETVNLYVGLGNLYREWGDLETAAQYLSDGQEASERILMPGSEYRLNTAMAQIKAAHGDWDEALEWLQEAERLYRPGAIPELRPLPALKAKLWIRQGRIAEALDWVREQSLSADDEISFLHEFDYLTLARVILAQYELEPEAPLIQAALALLDRLLVAAQETGRMGSVIEILILQALAHQAKGDQPNAIATIQRALALAEPEAYIGVFADEGQSMRTLLAATLAQAASPAYVARLIQAIDLQGEDTSTPPDPNQLLIEPLSDRELEVLDLLANGQSNQAIADELVIAVSTVKKHVNNIFGKLGVANRTQAVNRARDLTILQ